MSLLCAQESIRHDPDRITDAFDNPIAAFPTSADPSAA